MQYLVLFGLIACRIYFFSGLSLTLFTLFVFSSHTNKQTTFWSLDLLRVSSHREVILGHRWPLLLWRSSWFIL